MEKATNIEHLELELRFRVEKAKGAALFVDEFHEKKKQFNTLQAMRETGTLPKEAEDKYRTLQLELIGGRVDVDNLYEYRKVLELAELSPEQVNNILNHENAHANTADQTQSQKFNGYRIQFTKDRNGDLLVQPFAKLETDYSFSDEQIMKDRMNVLEAPVRYGDRLSGDDKEKIQALQNELIEKKSIGPTAVVSSVVDSNKSKRFDGFVNFWRGLFK